MQLEHAFSVPRPAGEVFEVLRDLERIAPCMPGASLDGVEGEEYKGTVKVKVGPMQLTYSGTARFVDVDEEARRATLEAVGKETRGGGRASATVNAEVTEDGGQTHVRVVTDLSITGRPAQFGRGVMADVGDKLIGQFADCLAAEMTAGGEGAAGAAAGAGAEGAAAAAGAEGAAAAAGGAAEVEAAAPEGAGAAGGGQPGRVIDLSRERRTPEAIDLFDAAGSAVAKRLVPVAAGVALLGLVVWLVRRASR